MIVAEQVCAALEGRVVTNAVNMPAVAPEELERLRPYLPLAAKLAALAVELAGGNPTRLDLQYLGALSEEDTRLLTVAALNGVFHGRVENINYVNAPLVAAERGLEVREESSSHSPDFTSVVAVTAHTAGEPATVAGTVSGREQRARLVQALGYAIEVELDRLMLFAENDDQPGMIGALGRILGEAGINIANMAVSRDRREALRAHGAHARLAAVARGARAPARGAGIRGRALPRPPRGVTDWPEPIERVAAVLRDAHVETRIEEFADGTPTADAAAQAVGCGLGQIVQSSSSVRTRLRRRPRPWRPPRGAAPA